MLTTQSLATDLLSYPTPEKIRAVTAFIRLMQTTYQPFSFSDGQFKCEGDLVIDDPDITALPDNLAINGNLNLSGSCVCKLPDNLLVVGDLFLHRNVIVELAEALNVGGTVWIAKTNHQPYA